MFCVNCGKEMDNGTKFCPYCGADQTGGYNTNENLNLFGNEAPKPKKKGKVIAVVLILFLVIAGVGGFIGFRIHKKILKNTLPVVGIYNYKDARDPEKFLEYLKKKKKIKPGKALYYGDYKYYMQVDYYNANLDSPYEIDYGIVADEETEEYLNSYAEKIADEFEKRGKTVKRERDDDRIYYTVYYSYNENLKKKVFNERKKVYKDFYKNIVKGHDGDAFNGLIYDVRDSYLKNKGITEESYNEDQYEHYITEGIVEYLNNCDKDVLIKAIEKAADSIKYDTNIKSGVRLRFVVDYFNPFNRACVYMTQDEYFSRSLFIDQFYNKLIEQLGDKLESKMWKAYYYAYRAICDDDSGVYKLGYLSSTNYYKIKMIYLNDDKIPEAVIFDARDDSNDCWFCFYANGRARVFDRTCSWIGYKEKTGSIDLYYGISDISGEDLYLKYNGDTNLEIEGYSYATDANNIDNLFTYLDKKKIPKLKYIAEQDFNGFVFENDSDAKYYYDYDLEENKTEYGYPLFIYSSASYLTESKAENVTKYDESFGEYTEVKPNGEE